MSKIHQSCVYLGDALALYNFGEQHPFGPNRHQAFKQAFEKLGLNNQVDILNPATTTQQIIELFHTHDYVNQVIEQSKFGTGYLDQGDTPAFIGMYEAASTVVGTVINAIDRLMNNEYKRAFIPIAGLHHARRHVAAGFCVFNDCGVSIEYLRSKYELNRVAYIDIDAHHGDGVFYSFDDDPDLIFADFHEDGKHLYPGTGAISETGSGKAKDTKLNIPMPPEATDKEFKKIWPNVESYIRDNKPEFILLQGGADSIQGDPITHLAYSEQVHAFVVKQLCEIADEHCEGRILIMGGGGYNLDNIAKTWTAMVSAMV